MSDKLYTNRTTPDVNLAVHRCEFFEDCALFAHLCTSRDKVYRTAYCLGDYPACERRTLRLQGVDAPDDLMPYGYRLQPDGTAYPSVDPNLHCDTRPIEIGLLIYWTIVLGSVMVSSTML